MNIEDIIGLYIKDYITNKEFEKWVYNNDEELNNFLDEDIYLQLISADYENKQQTISIKTILKDNISRRYSNEFENINDSYVEKLINRNIENDEILELLKQKYKRKDKVEFDCTKINSLNELHYYIKKKFGFSQYYGMNWDALRDFLRETELPKEVIFNGWSHLVEVMPKDSRILRNILQEYVSNDSKVMYK